MRNLSELLKNSLWLLMQQWMRAKGVYISMEIRGKEVKLTFDFPDQVVRLTGKAESKPRGAREG